VGAGKSGRWDPENLAGVETVAVRSVAVEYGPLTTA